MHILYKMHINHTIGSPYKALDKMMATSSRLPSNNIERKLARREPSPRAISSARTAAEWKLQFEQVGRQSY